MKSIKCICGNCTEDEVFECEECKRLVPWCKGCSDDYEELCDDCAARYIEENKQFESELIAALNNFGHPI